MNAWLVSGEAAWQLAGWTMLHFLWVGAIVALAGGAMRVACRRARPGVRYLVSLLTLAGLAAAPVGIAIWLAGQGLERFGLSTSGVSGDFESRPRQIFNRSDSPTVIDLARTPIVVGGEAGASAHAADELLASDGMANDLNPSPSPSLPGRGIAEAVASSLPWVWLAGAPVTFLLLATGLVGSRRLRRQCAAVSEGATFEALERIKKLMRVTRRVALAACEHVAQPVLVGIVRPTILLPAAALTGWSPAELEMVLVHELAHVRRWDNLVNLVQRLVESALFFHPAVWLASRQVRRDREECCDAAVVGHTRRPVEYAELLVAIAGKRARSRARIAEANLALASAMADHPLAGRIRRILKLEDEPMWVSRSTLVLVFVLGASLLAAVMALPPTGGAVADDSPTPPSPVAAATDGGEEEAQSVTEGEAPDEAKTPAAADRRQVEITPKSARAGARGEDAPARAGYQNFVEYELPKLKNDIALYQSQLLQLQKQREELEVMKDVALQSGDSRAHSVLQAAVQAEVDEDPTIAKYQQSLLDINQAIQQQASASRNQNSGSLKRLVAQRQQTEAKMQQYRVHAEKAARERLAKVPNEALRSAMVEYQIRAASIATRKAELEQKLKAAEARITEMAAGNGEAPARAGYQNFDEYELPKLKNDIALYQSQLLQLQKEREDIGALRESALEKSLEDDPRLNRYKQQIAELDLQIRRMAAADVDQHDDALTTLVAKKQRIEKMLEMYQRRAEEETVSGLAKTPNEALRTAMAEFHTRARSLAQRKREVEQKLKAAEDRITEMAAGNGEAAARPKGRTQSAAERARAARATYADAGSPNFEMAQVQERILTYQAALMAQEKESQDLEVRKELAAMQAQRAANSDARVEEELEKDRRTKIYEDEAIELEKHLRALKGETTEASQERYEHVKRQYEQLLAEADEYRQEASRKYRERLEKQAQEMLDSSRVEYEIHAQALERRHAELTKKLNEAEAQFKELAKSAKERAASASKQNRYFYFSNQPRQTGETPESSDGETAADQPDQSIEPATPASSVYPGEPSPKQSPPQTGDIRTIPGTPVVGQLEQAPTQNYRQTAQPASPQSADTYTAPATPVGAKRTLQSGDVIRVTAAGVFPDQPLGDEFQVEEEGTVPLGPMYGRVKVAGRTVLEAQEAIKRHLEDSFKDPSVQVVLAGPAFGRTSQPAPQPGPGTRLFYDSKSFEQWQQLWQNELKTEKRAEAIEALAAFGRAGMANEAAEAILEVAGQYDFYSIDYNSQEGQLKNQVIQLLTATNTSRLRESAWLPALVRRLDADPARWKWLAWQLLNNLIAEDEAVREPLFKLAASQDEDIRKAARWALANSDPTRTDPKVMAEIVRLVGSDDVEEIKTGISMLVYSPKLPGGQRFQPAKLRNAASVVPHLFHHDGLVQQTAREAIMSIDRADAEPIVADLLERLKEADEEATKLAAIRALAAIGPNAAEAEPVMRELIAGHEPKLAAAAVVAVDRMHAGSNPGMGMQALRDHLSSGAPPAGDGLHVDDQMIEGEREALFTPRDDAGGGFGGGRGGF